MALLLPAAEAVYLPFPVLAGKQTLFGWDYMVLHIRRLAFARDALLGPLHMLPAWCPRELLGTPFSSNLQSFPWIPVRLPLLLLDPEKAYGAAIAIAVALAALCTYLFCRRAGLSRLGAAAAAWTFACAGFFASRVEVGHLPLLEAYPSLPLLLWLVDRAIDPARAAQYRRDLAFLALATASTVVAGHPQLPAYSVGAAILYVLWRARGWLRSKLVAAIALGASATLVVSLPMLLLIRRSTRLLHLPPPSNDIDLPYRRLLALLVPGIDGFPPGTSLSAAHPFTGYPNFAYFWDTVGYVGLLPLAAAILLLITCIVRRRLPPTRWSFLAVLGLASLVAALPLVEPLRHLVPGTLLRSPARLLYLTTFALSAALGAGIDAILRWRPNRARLLAPVAAALCLGFQAWDLGGFARLFIHAVPRHDLQLPEFESILASELKDARVGVGRNLALVLSRNYDDAGTFDSILLAGPFRAVLALTAAPPGYNEQVIDAARLSPLALRATGVRFVITSVGRNDLDLVKSALGLHLYRVANPAPRAAFVPTDAIVFRPRDSIPGALLDDYEHSSTPLVLAEEDRAQVAAPLGPPSQADHPAVAYSRPSSDEILIRANTTAGVVSVLESYDPGWRATVDGVPAGIVEANGFIMAVPVSAGNHVIRLRYHTPGRLAGAVLSLLSLGLLGVCIRTRGASASRV